MLTERLDAVEMEALMKTEQPELVIDATHPYAAEVTENIQQAAKKAGIEYLRVLRETEAAEMYEMVYVDSVEAAAEWLDGREGQILGHDRQQGNSDL